MKYKCFDCGREFDELATWQESRGEFWGFPAYESMTGCPYCFSGDVEETDKIEDEDDDDDDVDETTEKTTEETTEISELNEGEENVR